MTNSMDNLPPMGCPKEGGDLMPLLIVSGVWLLAYIACKALKKRKGKIEMKTWKKVAIGVTVLVAIVTVLAFKKNRSNSVETVQLGEASASQNSLPRLVDLGADKCIPCKTMAPILIDMKTHYADQLRVDFIDVWKNPDEGKKYGIRMIPTQIFFNAQGQELFRHEGFYSKEGILTKWRELGVTLTAQAPHAP